MIKYFNDRIKLFSIWDIKLAQMAAMCVMIILIKLIPQIISLEYIWYILLAAIFGIRPLYLVFFKKE
ncbi:MAG: hypothetical protein K9N09_03650 [Candidatus Cloacimonetes bacterium]|nr:hypothetical protein [Candidatus Cloacimonadota bacterium]MCF7814561.1 hypothetical protein [Candidatus Cloacimonadota bacterium]MCF7867773.1 hypothetical protein [Candidatus Cloacimonadota bacterium]MCF7883249.1 hypothetical protein [Candidatus Cloacimonadota bacterium]